MNTYTKKVSLIKQNWDIFTPKEKEILTYKYCFNMFADGRSYCRAEREVLRKFDLSSVSHIDREINRKLKRAISD